MEYLFLICGYIACILYLLLNISAFCFPQKEKILNLSSSILILAIVLHGIALIARWIRLGHGPYLGLYEGVSSGLWVSTVIYAHLIVVKSSLKKTGIVGGVVIVVWYTWILVIEKNDAPVPPVYETWWFAVHVVSGKISYGLLFPIFVLSVSDLLPSSLRLIYFQTGSIEKLVYRYMSMVFTFATAMMISGGIWAQKAWGREWNWDSLEVWSLIVWLSYALYLHLRITYSKLFRKIWSLCAIIIYVLTFYNIFGIPFVSKAIHKGVI